MLLYSVQQNSSGAKFYDKRQTVKIMKSHMKTIYYNGFISQRILLGDVKWNDYGTLMVLKYYISYVNLCNL